MKKNIVIGKTLPKEIRENLLRIGNNVASTWGASCYKYKVSNKERKVIFECVEHGELFVTEIEFDNLLLYYY